LLGRRKPLVYVQKHLFHTPKLNLDIATAIPATVGYETYGSLSPSRDNAILICHPFHATSHAAGRYSEADAQPGWWDALIGPGKAFDTDRYFIICADTLCNLQAHNPLVVTTGPATIDPATGRPYGPAFPQVTLRDSVRLHHLLLESLGITQLACVAGPGTGGFMALEWAVTYPDMVEKVVAVAAAHQTPATFALSACQAGIDAITADAAYQGGQYYEGEGPVAGLRRAVFLLHTLSRSDSWVSAIWERKTAKASAHPRCDREGRFAFQAEMARLAEEAAAAYDANHFLYTARAALLHDIGYGNRGLEVAAQKIKASLLLLPIESDLLCPPEHARALAQLVTDHGGFAEVVPIATDSGHLAAVEECSKLTEPITRFLRRGDMH
jgi:homoserine O-acetyltransferase/O-succinyltransferase